MQCAHCATPVPDGARFCHSCGSQVSDAEGQAAATASMDRSAFLHMEALLREETRGEFEIERMLGRGGMAVVYLATEVHLSRKVAIKVLPPELTFGHGVERFKREAKTAAALDHPNIIPIYRVASSGKLFWYAMKFLEGRSLDELLKERPRFELEETVAILSQVADALDYAHEHNVVHRDVKPANVMLDSRDRVVVTDFGIAKALTEGTLTASGSVIGTPYYMSPEQGMGKPVTGAADLYSVAVMAYRMLSGQVPFEGDSAIDILHKHCMVPPPPLETAHPHLPRHVYLAIHKGLEKTAERRFKTVGALVEALRRPHDVVATAASTAGDRASDSDVATVVVPASVGASASLGVSRPAAHSGTGPATPATPMPQATTRMDRPKRRALPALAAALVLAGGATGVWFATRGGPAPTAAPADQPSGGEAAVAVADSGVTRPTGEPDSQPAAPTTGQLIVRNLPQNGIVLVNDVRRGGTEFDLPPSRYQVEIRAEGFETQVTTVEVTAGFPTTVMFNRVVATRPTPLAPQRPAGRPAQAAVQRYAWLRVASAPVGAVTVDAENLGERRVTDWIRVTAGLPHQVVVRWGADRRDSTVTLSAGDSLLVRIRSQR